MSTFRVTAEWQGSAALEIEADDENRAEQIAKEAWCGFIVDGGEIEYVILDIEQVEA